MRPVYVQLLRLSVMLAFWMVSRDVHAKPTVYVTNYPLQYFTQRLAGESITLVYPVPAETDPALWKPDVPTIAALQKADVIILNGATYEKWLEKVSLPQAKLVNTSRSFHQHYIALTETATHSHGPAGAHAHAGTAFTTWLNLQFAAQQAQAIAQALERLMPEQRAMLTTNATALQRDLLALDQRLTALVTGQRPPPLVATHPVYQYLAQRYGLNVQSVLWEPEVMPEAPQWQRLQALLGTHAASWMLWERPPLRAAVEKLQALGVRSVVFDPCGNTPARGDFLSVMQDNVTNLEQALQER